MKKAAILLIFVLSTWKLFAQSNPAGTQPKQDTARHKTARYGSVALLLKGMPGFEVGDDGTVFHNGQQINVANINGKDYIGTDIGKIIKRLPAAMVDNIDVVADDHLIRKGAASSGNPQEILSIIVKEVPTFFPPNFSGYPKFRMRGRRFLDDYYVTGGLGFPTETDYRNPSDRTVDLAIRNMQASTSSMYEVDDYGDQIPHFIIKEWPGPGKPRAKKDKKAISIAPDVKPVQPN